MAKQNEDTNGIPVSILDCGTSATVVTPYETIQELGRERLRQLRQEAEAQAN